MPSLLRLACRPSSEEPPSPLTAATTAGDTDAVVEALRKVFRLLEVSRWYPNRGGPQLGRRYVEANSPECRIAS